MAVGGPLRRLPSGERTAAPLVAMTACGPVPSSSVGTSAEGDLVVAPFAVPAGTCRFCREGLHTSCEHGTFWDTPPGEGGRDEAVRVPLADAPGDGAPWLDAWFHTPDPNWARRPHGRRIGCRIPSGMRHPMRVRGGPQPFRPDRETPSMTQRWATTYSSSTGTLAMTAPAISRS